MGPESVRGLPVAAAPGSVFVEPQIEGSGPRFPARSSSRNLNPVAAAPGSVFVDPRTGHFRRKTKAKLQFMG